MTMLHKFLSSNSLKRPREISTLENLESRLNKILKGTGFKAFYNSDKEKVHVKRDTGEFKKKACTIRLASGDRDFFVKIKAEFGSLYPIEIIGKGGYAEVVLDTYLIKENSLENFFKCWQKNMKLDESLISPYVRRKPVKQVSSFNKDVKRHQDLLEKLKSNGNYPHRLHI